MGCGSVNPTSIGQDYQQHSTPGVTAGLGCIVALHYYSSTSYQIRLEIRYLVF